MKLIIGHRGQSPRQVYVCPLILRETDKWKQLEGSHTREPDQVMEASLVGKPPRKIHANEVKEKESQGKGSKSRTLHYLIALNCG